MKQYQKTKECKLLTDKHVLLCAGTPPIEKFCGRVLGSVEELKKYRRKGSPIILYVCGDIKALGDLSSHPKIGEVLVIRELSTNLRRWYENG